MSISRERVLALAKLARLDLDDAELAILAADLARILAYADRLEAGPGASPSGDPVPGTPLREDGPGPSLPPGAAVAPAPERANGLFKVPPALGSS